MYDIKIGRFDDDPTAQGVVRPADDSWQVVVDSEGFPHFYIRVQYEDGKAGKLCLDDVLPDGLSVASLMRGTFGGALSEEDEAAAIAEHNARIAATGRPCPR